MIFWLVPFQFLYLWCNLAVLLIKLRHPIDIEQLWRKWKHFSLRCGLVNNLHLISASVEWFKEVLITWETRWLGLSDKLLSRVQSCKHITANAHECSIWVIFCVCWSWVLCCLGKISVKSDSCVHYSCLFAFNTEEEWSRIGIANLG